MKTHIPVNAEQNFFHQQGFIARSKPKTLVLPARRSLGVGGCSYFPGTET